MDVRYETLESLCELIVDCPHSTPKWTDEGIVVLRNQNIRNGVLDLTDPSFTNEEDYQKRIKRAVPQAGDIVFTREAPMGEVCLIPKDLKCCLGQRQVLLRPKKGISGEYLFWALQSPYVQHQISWNEGTGTTVSNVRIPVLKALSIPRHPQDEAEVAGILSALANKIQLNRQTNQTLEQMAQALFKSWFVDFDPVIDNALAAGNPIPEALQARADHRAELARSGNAPQLPDHIRTLFPDRFTHHPDMGWIPEGWEVKPVGKVLENVGGGTPRTKEDAFWAGGLYPFCTPKDMSLLTSKTLLETERHLTDAGVAKISSGQLPKGTVLMSSRAPIGYLAITEVPVSVNQGIIAMKPNDQFGSEYILSWAEANMDEVISRANGSTFLEISKKNFREIPFLMPEVEVLTQFDAIAKPYFQRIVSIQKEVNQLTKLRDTQLPKLISGELRLRDAS